MRRLTKKITSIVLLASFTASLSSMALAADVGTVTDDCVRLRRKASTSSDSLGMLVKGDKVSILDQEDNGWLKITYTDSEGTHTGYVSGEFVKTNSTKKTDSKKNPSKDTKKATKAEQKTNTAQKTKKVKKQQAAADTSAVSLGAGTVTNGGKKFKEINLRASSATDADVICKIPVGSDIEILADKDAAGWYQVRYTAEDKTVYSGYMLGKYVQTAVSAQPATAATIIGTKKAHKAINIRAEKSLDADILCKVPVGGTLDVIAEADADGWCQVSYQDSTGTYNGYMREEHVDTDNTDAADLTGVVKTKKKYINIRSAKSADAEVVCKVPAGKSVSIIGALDEEGWYQVSYKNDKGTHKGYMMAQYISIPSISSGTIGTSSAVLRSAADSSSDMFCVIPEGNKVSVLDALGDWYQVEYNDQVGYVDASCVESEALSKSKGYGTISVDTLNVRAKRNTESNVVTKMSKGTTFRITSVKDGWYGVTYNGVDGYAKAEYVTATDTIDAGYIQVTSQTLKLRSGAGTDYDQLAIVPYGTVLNIHGSLGSWYQVKYNGKEGYVCGDYTSATTSGGYKAYPDFAKVTASALGLRAKPGTDSDKTFTIPNGTVVSVRGMQDGWYKVVVYGTHTGYIDPAYTERSSGPATVPQVTTTTTGTTGTTTTGTTGTTGSTGSTTTSSASSSSSSSSSSGSSGGGSGAAVLAYAQRFVGNPYKWGGTSLTNGADCSGFVQSVYAHFGKSLPHSSYADAHVGRGVSKSDMRPGDIVVYGGHVGIYAGGGKLLSALGKKYGITYCSVNYKPIQAVRRLF